MPSLHSPVVSVSVPSMSILAQSKKSSGCFAQTFRRDVVEDVDEGEADRPRVKRRQKSPAVVGSGMRRCSESVEKILVVAAKFDVLQAGAIAQRRCRRC